MKKTKLISTISTLTLGCATTGLFVASCSCSNQPTVDKTAIDVTSNPGTKITLGTIISNKTQVNLGSFKLIDKDGNVITTDKSNELTLSFATPNDTGFIDGDINIVFNENDINYNVSLVDGVASSTPCHGSVSITWNNQGTKIESLTKLNLNIVNDSRKDLSKSIYGFDCSTTYKESDNIPVIVGSGVYLELKNPDNGERMEAKWMLIGGDFNVELLNTTSETPINALKVNSIADQAEIKVTVRAIPLQTTLYKDAYFTLTLTKSDETNKIITAAEGTSNYVLQYQSVQVTPNDIFNFTLNNATATSWTVTDAKGGTQQDPAKKDDVKFDSVNVNQLIVNKTFNEGATYTIQANYDGSEAIFKLSLIAGAKVNSTFTDASESKTVELKKNTQLEVDIAANDVFSFTVTDYEGIIDHWTAFYDRRSPYVIPSFNSPVGDTKTATWTVTAEDVEKIPASSYIYFRAYKANDSVPVATFIFQTKVHILSGLKFGSEILPWAGQDKLYHYGSVLHYTESNITAKIDNTGSEINPYTTVADSPTNEYIWWVTSGNAALEIKLYRGERSTISIPVQAEKRLANGINVIEYSSLTVFNVWDYYVAEPDSATSGSLTIDLSQYQDAECDTEFHLMKNDEICSDPSLKWEKTPSLTSLDGDAANADNYDIVLDKNTGYWKIIFTKPQEGGQTPTKAGSGTITFKPIYPGDEQPTTYQLPSFTVNVSVTNS